MHRITLIVFLLLLIPDIYIYLIYIFRKVKNRWLHAFYWLPTVLLLTGYSYYMYCTGDNVLANHTQAIGKLAIGLFLFSIPKIAFIICSILGLLLRLLYRPLHHIFVWIGLFISIACFAGILYGATLGLKHFQVKQVTYYHPKLPKSFEGYTITQVSDIHIGSWKGKEGVIRRMVELVNSQHADMIVFTGDLVNQRSAELIGFQNILSDFHARDGVYSILGNHDYGTYYHWANPKEVTNNMNELLNQEKSMGWQLLNNDHRIIHRGNDSIALIGVGNDGEPPLSRFADLKKASKDTKGMFRILLSHNPTHWKREVLPQTNIELMLSGHTHAMQGIFFGHSLASLLYPEWGGMYAMKNRQALYVNVGIGYVGLPFRFGAWPEITVIKLKCGNKAQFSK